VIGSIPGRTDQETNMSKKQPSLVAYTVRDLPNSGESSAKAQWSRVGAAWTNKDGGYTIMLDCIPLTGRIVLAKPRPAQAAPAK
jgi:hypothetical protein